MALENIFCYVDVVAHERTLFKENDFFFKPQSDRKIFTLMRLESC